MRKRSRKTMYKELDGRVTFVTSLKYIKGVFWIY